jgi:hypothetical protein
MIPTGDVTFTDNGVLLGTAPLDVTGTARLTATGFIAGTHAITASYSGDIVDRTSSATLTLTVAPGPSPAVQTTTTVTVSPGRIVAGQSVAISAHVVQTGTPTTPPAGPLVTFTANGNWIGQAALDANGNATVTVSGWVTGTYDVRASYIGDINDLPSAGNAPLTVVPSATPLVITAPSASITYGGTVPSVLTPTYSGFVPGDTVASLSAPATCTTTAAAGSPVGTYPVTCSGAAGSIYAISYVAGSISITPATLTVAAVSTSMTAGQAVPALTYTISGFVNGQTLATSGVNGSAACTTTATAASPAGTYPIVCTQGTLTATNYRFAFVAGTLTVTPRAPEVCGDDGNHSDDKQGSDKQGSDKQGSDRRRGDERRSRDRTSDCESRSSRGSQRGATRSS